MSAMNASPVRAEAGGRGATLPVARPAAEAINAAKPKQQTVSFVYGGKTGMTVVGPVSGRVYRFDRPGAQVSVDPRDKFLLATIPNLMLVK
jgi:hypothetical protein